MLIFVAFLMIPVNAEHHDLNNIADHLTGVKLLPLVHRDKLVSSSSSSSHNDESYRGGRESRLLSGFGAGFGMGVVGAEIGQYYVTLGVGSPPIDQTLKIDTGSDLMWIQCQGCREPDDCFLQPHQRFDPKNSTWVECHSETCFHLLDKEIKDGCKGNEHQYCGYRYGYQDGTYTSGNLILETLTINGTSIPNVIVGCANGNHISFNNRADGMLGLGRGSLSYTSQGNGQTGGAFRFCLGQNGGRLNFGRSNFPGDNARWASLILNEKHPSYYYIELLGIEVNGKALKIPQDTFQITDNGDKGGVIIDTGTSFTYLPEVAYDALRDTLNTELVKLFNPIASSVDPTMHTCYSLGSGVDLESVTASLPRVSFIFRGMHVTDPTIQVNATNILYVNNNIACLAFAPSTTMGVNILAGRQLEDIQITIDALAGNIGFGPNGC